MWARLKNATTTAMLAAVCLQVGASSENLENSISYLCIGEHSGGVVYSKGEWQGTAFKPGAKFLVRMVNGLIVSVKEFGVPDEFELISCGKLTPTNSQGCRDNFSQFRFQPSTRKFIASETAGYTTEFEEAGVDNASTLLSPRIIVGICEKL